MKFFQAFRVKGVEKWVCGSTGEWCLLLFFFFLLINWKIEEPDTLMGLIQQSGRVC